MGSLGAITWVWLLFDQHVAQPIERLSGGLRTGTAPDPSEGRYLADLAPAAREAAEARARSAEALTAEVQRHAADVHRDRTMLEAILADIGAGVVMSDAKGRVIFYNAEAARLLPGLAMGRPLGPTLDPAALAEGCQRLEHGSEDEAGLICSLPDGRRIGGQLRQVEGGHVLLLRPRHDDGPAATDPRAAWRTISAFPRPKTMAGCGWTGWRASSSIPKRRGWTLPRGSFRSPGCASRAGG